MKKITELTDSEAIELLLFVYPKIDKRDYIGISYEPLKDENGKEYLTQNGKTVVGIRVKNGTAEAVVQFDDMRVVYWLYTHGYDIEKFLIANSHLSTLEYNFEVFVNTLENMPSSNLNQSVVSELANKYFRFL